MTEDTIKTQKISVNGKEYNSIEEMDGGDREIYEQIQKQLNESADNTKVNVIKVSENIKTEKTESVIAYASWDKWAILGLGIMIGLSIAQWVR